METERMKSQFDRFQYASVWKRGIYRTNIPIQSQRKQEGEFKETQTAGSNEDCQTLDQDQGVAQLKLHLSEKTMVDCWSLRQIAVRLCGEQLCTYGDQDFKATVLYEKNIYLVNQVSHPPPFFPGLFRQLPVWFSCPQSLGWHLLLFQTNFAPLRFF